MGVIVIFSGPSRHCSNVHWLNQWDTADKCEAVVSKWGGGLGLCVYVCPSQASPGETDDSYTSLRPINCHPSCWFNSLTLPLLAALSYHFRKKTASSVYVKWTADLQESGEQRSKFIHCIFIPTANMPSGQVFSGIEREPCVITSNYPSISRSIYLRNDIRYAFSHELFQRGGSGTLLRWLPWGL